MKRIITLGAVALAAFGLTGCELNNTEMENIISKCKENTECKAILDREIDEALAERGIFGESENWEDYDIFYELDLSEEEVALLETLENLDIELSEKLDAMTDEELQVLEEQELEIILGREITEAEKAAIELVESLYDFEYEDIDDVDYIAYEIEHLEFYLGRELTTEEKAAFDLIEAITDENWDNDVFTTEEEAAFDLIDALYEEAYDITEQEELALLLDRELTAEELNAFTVLETMTDDDWYEEEFTPEQEAAFDLIDALYMEVDAKFEIMELEMLLGRELTTEEIDALNTVNTMYESMEDNFYEYDEDAIVNEMVAYYELVLNRTLTDQEKDAIEFSLEFMIYDEFEDFDDYDYEDFDYDDHDDYDFDED